MTIIPYPEFQLCFIFGNITYVFGIYLLHFDTIIDVGYLFLSIGTFLSIIFCFMLTVATCSIFYDTETHENNNKFYSEFYFNFGYIFIILGGHLYFYPYSNDLMQGGQMLILIGGVMSILATIIAFGGIILY